MTITKTELDRRKKLAEAILKAKGENVSEALGEFYQTIINNNMDTLGTALAYYEEKKTNNSQHGGMN